MLTRRPLVPDHIESWGYAWRPVPAGGRPRSPGMPKPKQFEVTLSDEERAQLVAFTTKGIAAAREVRRARILLLAAEGRTDGAVADAVGCCVGTVARVRRRCAAAGVEA